MPQSQPPAPAELAGYAVTAAGGRILPLVDIGVNFPGRVGEEAVAGQLRRAAACGVTTVIITGSSVSSTRRAADLAERHGGHGVRVYFTAGVHPHDAKTFGEGTAAELRELAGHPACCAVGETGLDYDRMFTPREQQLAALDAQLTLAAELGAPLFLHERDRDAAKGPPLGSHADLIRALERHRIPPGRVCVHCFTAGPDALRDYVSRGYTIGLTGFAGMRTRGAHVRAALRDGLLPLSQLLLETDCPYMRPDEQWMPPGACTGGWLSRGTEPCVTAGVCRAVAACVDAWTEESVARQTTANAVSFFRLGDPPAPPVSSAGDGSPREHPRKVHMQRVPERTTVYIGNLRTRATDAPPSAECVDIACDRTSLLGNPFPMPRGGGDAARRSVCDAFADYLDAIVDGSANPDAAEHCKDTAALRGLTWKDPRGGRYRCPFLDAGTAAVRGELRRLQQAARGGRTLRLMCHCYPLLCHTMHIRRYITDAAPEHLPEAEAAAASPARREGYSAAAQGGGAPAAGGSGARRPRKQRLQG
eukprot:TRINITY_DN13648_c0_g1_i1.p1 TRINITY_DN13648_c0_g1~~TRINITY_DN13648_c0_g1_i1.p1  ORF type:complete len:533 (+),score=68.39 TRINITY_DN13648_c0_g1_i1:72-1670(+)